MRISDSLRYRLFQQNITKVGEQLDDVEKKISTQRNINTPSDDPIKYATSIQYDVQRSVNTQYSNNLQRLSTLVSMYDASFSSMSSQMSDVAQMANSFDSMGSDLRQSAVQEIEGVIEQFVTVGNTKVGNTYIFGGQQSDVSPFRLNNDYSVTYTVGADGEDVTSIYVDSGQTSKFGVSGREAFYDTKKIAFGNVTNGYGGEIYANTDSFAYVVNGTNNTIHVNGTAVALASGVYTGSSLAKEIKTRLGADYSVAFDSTTRKFSITNNTGATVTLNWSDAGATAGNLLGFDNTDSVIATGRSDVSDVDSGRKAFLVEITGGGGATTGALGTRAAYRYSIDGGATWTAGIAVNTGGADTTADITISTGVNDTLYLNGAAVTIVGGTYTGDSLATEIQTRLNAVQAGHIVTYDVSTRKFSISNNTGAVESLNWSNTGANAAGVLGFDNVDSVISNGSSDVSDYDAGMFIDGSGVANTTNNRMKLLFGTDATYNLTGGDTFQVKDLSVFELLKNLKDAFGSDNSGWVSKNIKYIDAARDLVSKNNSIIAFQGAQAKTLIANNKTKDGNIQTLQSDLVNADMTELATEFSALLNTYQALLSTLAKMQSISILNYLK